MTEKRMTLEEIAEMIPGGGKIETMKRDINPAKQCPDGTDHEFEILIGGMGGRRCKKCGHMEGGMSQKEYFDRKFRKVD